MALNSRSTTTERNIQRAGRAGFHMKEQNRWEISSLEQNYKVTYHIITSLLVVFTFHLAIDPMLEFEPQVTFQYA